MPTSPQLLDLYSQVRTCHRAVPEEIRCFMEADDFEEAIRNVISIGADSDTLAAITGAITEAK